VRLRGQDVPEARRGNPRLVLRFTLFTAVGLAVTSVAIFLLVRGFVTGHAEDAVERNSRFLASAVLSRQLRPADFEPGLSVARKKQLDRLFREQVLVDDVDRATLYGADGVVSYSTAPSLIGTRTPDSDAVCARAIPAAADARWAASRNDGSRRTAARYWRAASAKASRSSAARPPRTHSAAGASGTARSKTG